LSGQYHCSGYNSAYPMYFMHVEIKRSWFHSRWAELPIVRLTHCHIVDFAEMFHMSSTPHSQRPWFVWLAEAVSEFATVWNAVNLRRKRLLLAFIFEVYPQRTNSPCGDALNIVQKSA
jgi:hypothetical protein